MPTHFLGLQGAAVLDTAQFQLAARVIDDLIAHAATGVIHGPAGAGKTFCVETNLERLREGGEHRVVTCSLSFVNGQVFVPAGGQELSPLAARCFSPTAAR